MSSRRLRVQSPDDVPRALERTFSAAIVTTKSRGTDSAARLIQEKLLCPDVGIAITIQNGINNGKTLARHVGPDRVVTGITSRGARLIQPGHVFDAGGDHTILCPLVDSFRNNRTLECVSRALQLFGPTCIVTDRTTFDRDVYTKLCVNAVINPLTAILGEPNICIVRHWERLEPMIRGVVSETREMAFRSAGVELPSVDELNSRIRQVAERTGENRSSMLCDIERGAPETEADYINGFVAEEMRRLGSIAPLNESLRNIVKGLVK